MISVNSTSPVAKIGLALLNGKNIKKSSQTRASPCHGVPHGARRQKKDEEGQKGQKYNHRESNSGPHRC